MKPNQKKTRASRRVVTRWSENVWLHKQQEVLLRRDAVLSRFRTKEDRDQTDQESFEDLKKLSPEKLVPVICFSEVHGWIAGYLMQKIGDGGSRILGKLETWKIIRVKKSSLVKRLNMSDKIVKFQFDLVVDLQEKSKTALMVLVDKKGKHA